MNNKYKLYFVAFALSFLTFIFNSSNVSAYSASISTSGTVNLEVSASGNGANVATDNITVKSTCPSGYTVSIKGPVDSTLYKVNQTTGKADKTNNSTSSKIVPTMGTKDNPLPIIGDDGSGNSYLGTWGYSMTNNLATGTFIGLTNTMTELLTRTTGTTNIGETIPIYYGASILPTTEPGQYKLAESTEGAGDNVITYYLTTDPGCGSEPTILDISTMQDMTSEICAATEIGATATLPDIRDGKTYNIRKMEDNKCWMVQNLALGTNSSDITLTPADSDVTSDFILPASAVQTSGNTDWSVNIDAIHVYNNGDTWIEPTSAGNNSVVHADGSTPPSQSQYVGNYYNWYTATAGTGTSSMTYGNAASSICPKGWKLPTGGADSDIVGLTEKLVNTNYATSSSNPQLLYKFQSAPYNFINSGFYLTQHSYDGASYLGLTGRWWTRTAFGEFSHNLVVSPKYIGPQDSNVRNFGGAVRCVAEEPFDTIETMQEMTSDICAAAAVGDQKVLWDNRDNKSYVVRKLADNRCWMVQNLRLGGNSVIVLTPDNTNITSNFTLSASTNSFGTTDDATGININRMHDNGNNWLTPIVSDSSSTVNTTGTPPSSTQYQGNHYNWFTATAGSGTYSTGADAIASQSICPKGWRLPTGGAIDDVTGNGEFQKLYDSYNGDFSRILHDFVPILSGWYDSYASEWGNYGSWWSSTASSANVNSALNLSAGNSYITPNNYGSRKRIGSVIRCIAQ